MKKVSSVSAVRKLDTKKTNTTWKLVRHLSTGFAYLIGMALVQEHVKIKETENGAEKMTTLVIFPGGLRAKAVSFLLTQHCKSTTLQ